MTPHPTPPRPRRRRAQQQRRRGPRRWPMVVLSIVAVVAGLAGCTWTAEATGQDVLDREQVAGSGVLGFTEVGASTGVYQRSLGGLEKAPPAHVNRWYAVTSEDDPEVMVDQLVELAEQSGWVVQGVSEREFTGRKTVPNGNDGDVSVLSLWTVARPAGEPCGDGDVLCSMPTVRVSVSFAPTPDPMPPLLPRNR